MKKVLRNLSVLLLTLSLFVTMCISAFAADKILRIEDLLDNCSWYVVDGNKETVINAPGSLDQLELKGTQAGGVMATYFENEKIGDGKIRFKLQVKRNPLWLAIMFRVTGDSKDMEPFYSANSKYALLLTGSETYISTWKSQTNKQVNLADAAYELFDDGEAHQVEIETKNLSSTKVEIKVRVDGKLVLEVVDDGNVEKYGGPAITETGKVCVHAYQAAASPLGPNVILSAAGQGAPIVEESSAPTSQAVSSTPTASKSTTSATISGTASEEASAVSSTDATVTESTVSTESENIISTASEASPTDVSGEGSNNGWIVWVIIGAVIVLAAAGVVIFLIIKKKKSV